MSEAGFYLVASASEPDLVRCYYCRREMDGWDPDDVPWKEHQRRECPFIKVIVKLDLTLNDFCKF
jgi:baculoviral IAP repeat-containing protein 5